MKSYRARPHLFGTFDTLIWLLLTPYWWNGWCNWTIACCSSYTASVSCHVHVRYTTAVCDLERKEKVQNMLEKKRRKRRLTHPHFYEILQCGKQKNESLFD